MPLFPVAKKMEEEERECLTDAARLPLLFLNAILLRVFFSPSLEKNGRKERQSSLFVSFWFLYSFLLFCAVAAPGS